MKIETPDPKDVRKSLFGPKLQDARKKALGDLMKIELKLNDKIFWWESPDVCRWEPWEESDEFAAIDPKAQDFHLHQDEYKKIESEKLFSAKQPRRCREAIEVKDFDLLAPPETMKLSVLIKDYLLPTTPVEYKVFAEQLQTFQELHREWKTILDAKKHCDESGANMKEAFDNSPWNFNICEITVGEFKKLFEQKSFQPRNLFPVEHRPMINIVTSYDQLQEIQDDREELRKQLVPDDDWLHGVPKPVKNEPLLLSELVNQVKRFNESLRPIFREIKKRGDSVTVEEKVINRRSKFQSVRQNRVSTVRMLRFVQTPPKRSEVNPKKPKARRLPTAASESQSFKETNSSIDSGDEQLEDVSESAAAFPRGQWSTRDVYEPSYDSSTKTFTFYAGKLGIFGLVTNKYSNLPLKSWEIYPSETGEKSVVMKIETRHVGIEIKIANNGYTFNITRPKKPAFQGISRPVKVFELKRILSSINLNLFPEVDASCYVANISEKHKPMEFHTYKSMAVYCLSHHYKWSEWNRQAHRRVAVFQERMVAEKSFKLVMVTPLRTACVDVHEDMNSKLSFAMNPPDQKVRNR